ncbi:helix-turn-helix transcriptional regulator [Streptomyces sp. NPDC050617]|uniref:helix-turn-helix transcriptional regulator n=1 Tax=Streptomyces sp. NPDC050617 TaxID=3154628 RepID=UPI0034408695
MPQLGGLAMGARRDRLAHRRKVCGYSQEQLADVLNVDRTSIGRWERGEASPRPFLWPKLARLLRVTPQELDRLLQPDSTEPAAGAETKSGGLDDVIRRGFLQLLTVTAAANVFPAHADATDHSHGYRPMNEHLWKVYSLASSKRFVYPLVCDQTAELATAIRGASTETARKQLSQEAGDLFQLAGEILFDGSRYTEAAHCYTLAASAAKEAGNPDLWACALTRHAYIGLYGDQKYRETIPLLELARAVAERGDTALSTRHWVAAVQAEAYAGIGELDACNRALDQAEKVHSLSGAVHNGGWLRFDGSRLAEERGTCLVRLGRFDLAEGALNEALRTTPSRRRRGSVLTDLAFLGAQRRDVDQIISYAGDALDLARQSASGYAARRLHSLQPRLVPFLSDRRVSDLNDRIAALAYAD